MSIAIHTERTLILVVMRSLIPLVDTTHHITCIFLWTQLVKNIQTPFFFFKQAKPPSPCSSLYLKGSLANPHLPCSSLQTSVRCHLHRGWPSLATISNMSIPAHSLSNLLSFPCEAFPGSCPHPCYLFIPCLCPPNVSTMRGRIFCLIFAPSSASCPLLSI